MTVALAVLPVKGLVFYSANIGGMNAPRFNDFLGQTRENLDPDEEVIFIYDDAPTHQNPAIHAANTELEMLPAYSPFLNIVEQAISSLKGGIKGDVTKISNSPDPTGKKVQHKLGVGFAEPSLHFRLLDNVITMMR